LRCRPTCGSASKARNACLLASRLALLTFLASSSLQVFDEKIAECTAAGMDGASLAHARTHSLLRRRRDALLRTPLARTGFLSKPLRLDELREVLATHKLA
jgi:hypothetical protein